MTRLVLGAQPFHETEVETGWFADELAGEVTEAGFRCWAAYDDDGQLAGSDRAWLVTHDLDTPARALYRSLGFHHLATAPSAGTTPTASSSAPTSHRVPSSGGSRRSRRRLGRRRRTW